VYLTEVDSNGLVRIDKADDGVMSIPEFRVVIKDKELGVECFTCIALVADHLTPIRHYIDKDKPAKAMGIVKNDRKAYIWDQEKIQLALVKYRDLQYNPIIEEKRALMEMQMTKLEEIKSERNGDKKVELFKQLNTIKGLIDNFNKDYADIDPFADGPVINGYKLSRLEEKVLDKSSFYNTRNSKS